MDDGKYFKGEIAYQVPIFLKYLALYLAGLGILGSLLIMPVDERIDERNKKELGQRLINEAETITNRKPEITLNSQISQK